MRKQIKPIRVNGPAVNSYISAVKGVVVKSSLPDVNDKGDLEELAFQTATSFQKDLSLGGVGEIVKGSLKNYSFPPKQ